MVVELAKEPCQEFDFKFALRRAPAHVTVRLGEHTLLRWLDTLIFRARSAASRRAAHRSGSAVRCSHCRRSGKAGGAGRLSRIFSGRAKLKVRAGGAVLRRASHVEARFLR